MEKKAILVALSVWFSTHQVYQALQALIHHSKAVRGQIHYMQASKRLFKLVQGKKTVNPLWQIAAHNNYEPTAIPQGNCWRKFTQTVMGKENYSQSVREGEKDTAKQIMAMTVHDQL